MISVPANLRLSRGGGGIRNIHWGVLVLFQRNAYPFIVHGYRIAACVLQLPGRRNSAVVVVSATTASTACSHVRTHSGGHRRGSRTRDSRRASEPHHIFLAKFVIEIRIVPAIPVPRSYARDGFVFVRVGIDYVEHVAARCASVGHIGRQIS